MTETLNTQQSILPDAESVAAAPQAAVLAEAPTTGLLVTNHLNLMYMLAGGLLMPPSGFGDKHYADPLAAYPGWLPLFVGQGRWLARAPRAALDASTAEATHLRAILLEIDLAGLRGPVHAFGEGGWTRRGLEEGIGRGEWLVLIPAPLPVSRIRSVLFRSAEEKREVQAAAEERNNAPLTAFSCKTAKARFTGDRTLPWPPPDGPEARDAALPAAQAAGGALAVLHQVANAGELSITACRAAFDPSSEPPDDSILGELPTWTQKAGVEVGAPPRTGRDLFWGAVQRLVENRRESAGRSPADVLVSFLRESSERMDAEFQARAADLVSTLEELGGRVGGGTVSEMLDQHQTPLSRAAILFLLRRKSREFLEFVEDYPQLEERERLAAAILFGVRDGWLKLPIDLRGSAELGKAVTHRMAALAHRLDESGFDLGEAPPRVRPLRELFGEPAEWDLKTEKAAVRLARGLKWNCIRTTVSLGRGRYQFRIEGGSAHIDFEGEPKVVTRVDRDRFLEALAGERMDFRVDQAVRKDLGP